MGLMNHQSRLLHSDIALLTANMLLLVKMKTCQPECPSVNADIIYYLNRFFWKCFSELIQNSSCTKLNLHKK